jgi:hypothetical protein
VPGSRFATSSKYRSSCGRSEAKNVRGPEL